MKSLFVLPDLRFAHCKRVLGWILAIYWGLLFISTHVPVPSGVPMGGGFDKVLHFVAYAALAFLLVLWRGPHRWVCCAMVIAAYSIADELLQIPVGRSCEFGDLVADWLGGAFGGLLAWVASRKLSTGSPVESTVSEKHSD